MASNIPGGYSIQNAEPIESKQVTANSNTRNGFQVGNVFEGLVTFERATKKLYVLISTGSGNASDTLANSAGSQWQEVGGGSSTNAFSTASIFSIGQSAQNSIFAQSPTGSIFISSSDINLIITSNQSTNTITFDFANSPIFTHITASGNISGSGNISITGDGTIGGNLTVSGRITAEEFHTEFVSASIIYQSGSTQFGNSPDDVHTFTGSLNLSGSQTISNNLIVDNNVGIGTNNPNNTLHVEGGITAVNITASNNISSSATLLGNNLTIGTGDSTIGGTTIFGNRVGIRQNSPQVALHISGNIMVADTAGESYIKIGSGSFGNQNAYIDFIGDNTYTNYGLRIIRSNNGEDAPSYLYHRGMGDFGLHANESANILFYTTNAERMRITDNGSVGIGTNNPNNKLQVEGGITAVNITASGNISSSAGLIGQTLTTSENGTIGGTLGVTGITTLQNNLIVSGNVFLGDDFTNDSVTIKGNKVSTDGASSGFTGNGWMITRAEGGETTLDIDNIKIRGTLSAVQFLAQQIRATNGSIYVSSMGRVASTQSLGTDSNFQNSSSFGLTFETGSGIDGHGFSTGDVIRAQRTSATNTSVQQYKSDLIVRYVQSTSIITASLMSGSGVPNAGYDYVRLGNTASNSDRRGNIYLTSDDTDSPFLDVVDGVQSHNEWDTAGNKIKVRLGNLSGLNRPTFGGSLSGYGLYASGSAYLEGGINATVGLIGGWQISSSKIIKNDIELNSNEEYIRAGNIASLTTGTGIFLSGSGEALIGNAAGKRVSFINGDLVISASNATLKGNTVEISGSNFHLLNGNITASNATLSGTITATAGAIGGWNITSTAITKSNIELKSITDEGATFIRVGGLTILNDGTEENGSGILLSSFIGDGSDLYPRFFVGNVDTSKYLRYNGNDDILEIQTPNFILDTNGNLTITGSITSTAGAIGGWNITSTAITKSNIELNSSQGFIKAGNIASLTTGTGIFLSGSGETLIGNAVGKRVSFINGDLLISSSNFVLQNGNITASNATLSGTITATAGAIGGWNITSTAITKSNIELNSQINHPYFKIGNQTMSPSGIIGQYDWHGFFVGQDQTGFLFQLGRYDNGNGSFITFESNSNEFTINTPKLKLNNGNLSLSGNITASAGLIGGFNTTTTEIVTTSSFTSGSFSSPYISLKANGQITGSDVLIRRKQSNNKIYTLLDTVNGVIDARNVGRQVVQDYSGMTLVGGTNNTWYSSSDCYYPIQLLQGENVFLISYSMLGLPGNGFTPIHYSNITISSASLGKVNNETFFDIWGGETYLFTPSPDIINGVYQSMTISPSGSNQSGIVEIPETFQGKYCLLKLVLNQSNTPGSTTTTAVRGLTISTTRRFASDVSSGDITYYLEKF